MKTERDKAFEKYVMSLRRFKTRDPMYIFALDENEDYDLQDVYDLHHAWVASDQREGYKLVPVEMSLEKADELSIIEWGKNKHLFQSINRDLDVTQVEEFRIRWCKTKANQLIKDYKEMVEGVI